VEPTDLFPIIAVLSIIGVEFGGWALLTFISVKTDELDYFRQRFFRAGHAHAGVLLVLSLVYFLYLPRADYSNGVEWLAGAVLTVGVLMQSGGFFIHLGVGQEGQSSIGTKVTRLGAVVIAAALIILAVGLIKTA
jgi:hypothetical protein